MAITRDGVPVRCSTFPGDTSDQAIIRTIKDDLDGWGLRRLVWVADRGFASAANRAYLTRGGGHYIHAEKLRAINTEAAAALARPGRYRSVAGNLRVKEVAVAPGGAGDGDDGARAARFVVCHNPGQAGRDQQVRSNLVAHLEGLIDGSDAWSTRRRDEDRVRAHVQLCWLTLLLIRVVENATADIWRTARHELDRMHLVTLATPAGQVAQRSTTTPGQKAILTALELGEPPRFFDFSPAAG